MVNIKSHFFFVTNQTGSMIFQKSWTRNEGSALESYLLVDIAIYKFTQKTDIKRHVDFVLFIYLTRKLVYFQSYYLKYSNFKYFLKTQSLLMICVLMSVQCRSVKGFFIKVSELKTTRFSLTNRCELYLRFSVRFISIG